MVYIYFPTVKTNDGKIVVHASMVDCIVRIYDALKGKGKESMADASSTNESVVKDQIIALLPSCDNRHFITMEIANMRFEISVWDVKQGKQVRIFKNIFGINFLRMISPTLAVGYIYNETMYH